ncbi:hypothetical protein [Proteiniclasticum ruminis]|uniref:Uncharacterized protein n=1 Tax=Proteiniclasticum ruminis TaxID=398199 RepID=A0A1G8G4L8_9CLOT|nr:hypothetical protein [Proteiniclasticum ruminis]SDH89378.1 hypothetical protein SAMN05421804_101142 [Proteiniclasticum ruminis]
MTYETTYNRWLQLTEEKKVLEQKLKDTTKELEAKNIQLHTFLSMMKKEEKDVENLEQSSLSSLFSKVTGKFEEKLVKEQEEYLQAKLNYDDKKNELELLNKKEQRLQSELMKLNQATSDLKESLLQDYPEGILFSKELEKRKEHLFHLQRELEEALDAVQHVKGYAEMAIQEFLSARGWSTYDTFFGGGLLADLAKYNRLDEANKAISRISAASKEMKKELRDVEMTLEHNLETVSGSDQFLDIAFDNIFSDWSIRGKIDTNLSAMNQYLEELKKIELQLKDALMDVHEKIRIL